MNISETQMQIREYFIMYSFRQPADRDYALARHLWFSDDFRQYSWAAAQALEKYFKAALLIKDVSVINQRHDLNSLWHNLSSCELFVCPKFYPVPVWLPVEYKQDWPTSNTKYISRLNTNGSPDARYDGEIVKINPQTCTYLT